MEKLRKIISIIVFLFSISIILINYISLIFPAIITVSVTPPPANIEPFEIGVWAPVVIIVNVVILFFVILCIISKNQRITNFFNFILNFEVSKRITALVLVLVVGLYIVLTVPELSVNEIDEWDDFVKIEERMKYFPFISENNDNYNDEIVKFSLLISSETLFQNMRVIPFLASIALLLLTYLFTLEITKKRFAGLVSMIILLQSFTFLKYDTTATYSNFWILFYVLSLYLLYKKKYISSVPFVLSIFSKAITIIYMPITFFFIFWSNRSKKEKIQTLIPYLVIIGIVFVVFLTSKGQFVTEFTEFDGIEFWKGMTVWSYQLRHDWMVLLFLLPLSIALFIKSQKGVLEADSLQFMFGTFLISGPILLASTGYDMQPYRFLPLIVFFAIGIGILFSRRVNLKA